MDRLRELTNQYIFLLQLGLFQLGFKRSTADLFNVHENADTLLQFKWLQLFRQYNILCKQHNVPNSLVLHICNRLTLDKHVLSCMWSYSLDFIDYFSDVWNVNVPFMSTKCAQWPILEPKQEIDWWTTNQSTALVNDQSFPGYSRSDRAIQIWRFGWKLKKTIQSDSTSHYLLHNHVIKN